jgi:hypothetical protein
VAAPFIPQVLFYEDFPTVASSGVQPLQACVVGPHAQLVRYGQGAEKPLGSLGPYVGYQDTLYPWPNLATGGIVDSAFVKLFADNARLVFYSKLQGIGSAVTVPGGATNRNRVRIAGAAGFVATADHARLAGLYGRDVRLGDRVRVEGSVSGNAYSADSYVIGFDGTQDSASVGSSTADSNNAATQAASVTIIQLSGTVNCNSVLIDATNYNGLVAGFLHETYTITVIQNSVGGDLSTALLRVKSASGLDDANNVVPAAAGSYVDVGNRGLRVAINQTNGPCDLIAGQVFQAVVNQVFSATSVTSGGAYLGASDDTLVVSVTRGGLLAESNPAKKPQITVTTVRGLDSSGPTTVTATGTNIPVGTKGVTIQLPNGTTGLCKGDQFYIPVTAAKLGVINTLILANALPSALQSATDLNLYLYTQKDVEVPINRAGFDPLVNYAVDDAGVTVKSGIVLYDPAFVDDGGAQIPLTLLDTALFVQYRAWLPSLAGTPRSISDVGNIDAIAGALDADNPLKYAVSKALLGANGTSVVYISVADPASPASWAAAIKELVGRADVYDIAPLTYDPAILSLFVAHVSDQSSPEKARPRRLVLGLKPTLAKPLVGPTTSSDGEIVLATLADDADTAGTQYTFLNIPADNAKFITNGVLPGDEVRFNYGVSFGQTTYKSYVVSRVLSETSLLLRTGAATPAGVPQRVEVWHALNTSELVDDLVAQAGAYGDKRVIAVWSDLIGLNPPTIESYHLAAAVAGQMAGVLPHQGLSNVTLSGFADVVRDHGLLNSDEVAKLCGNGVWLVSRDSGVQSNAVITRLGTTTSPTTILEREEMVQRNVDSMKRYLVDRLSAFLKGTNVTPSSTSMIRVEIDAAHNYLKSSGFTQALGGQLIDARLDAFRVHTVFPDRYVINVTWTIPVPLNTIEFHVTMVTYQAA